MHLHLWDSLYNLFLFFFPCINFFARFCAFVFFLRVRQVPECDMRALGRRGAHARTRTTISRETVTVALVSASPRSATQKSSDSP